MMSITRYLVAASLALVLLLQLASAARVLPAHEHIGTPAQHLSSSALPEHEHIGTPAQHSSASFVPAHEHIGTPAQHSSPPEHISSNLAALSKPRIPTSAEQSSPKLASRRHHTKKNASATIPNGKVTYYAGNQLLNPACPGTKSPNDASMIAAISDDSPFACGDRIKITNRDGTEAVVTVVDKCAGCDRQWLDVTKGVFKVFSPLAMGVLHDLSFTKVA